MDTELINSIVFPDRDMAKKFDNVQITIPKEALIHQQVTEGQ